ncbi:DUF3693 domain-containing protein [Vibrio coralliilyticus]|uniref:DUF3693 domain-containing protein n=1 Tax=Vibrio coralliilyticus TaxID=190893 RepID=UPI0002FE87CF|nr:DUF3693 domain-containing protein [Vibrio coralliilyticus]
MYINELLDAYKSVKNYVQDKQVAHDLHISVQKLSGIRKGERYLTEDEALFIADEVGADKETVLVYLAADKAKSDEARRAWASIAKKFKGLNFPKNSTIYTLTAGLFVHFVHSAQLISECALCTLC